MSLVEESLPGVGRVRKDFQVREDHVVAKTLQEREYEEHFDYNVQARRTAMQDAQMAKSFQTTEDSEYRQEESLRREQLRLLEEKDREEAEKYARTLEQQEIEAKRKDEEMVQRLHREEMEREEQRKRQEQEDMRMARQHSVDTEQFVKQRQQEALLGEKEAQRLMTTKTASKEFELPTYESLGFKIPKAPTPPNEEEEEFVDEAARQEEEDARLVREMLEREEREAERRRIEQEQADIEMARKLQEMESKSTTPKAPPTRSNDEEIAMRMEIEAKERRRKIDAQARSDQEVAQRMKADLQRQQSDQELTDWELAKRLQKAELVAHKKTTASRTTTTQGGGGGEGGIEGRSSSVRQTERQTQISPTQSAPASLTGAQRKPLPVQQQPAASSSSKKKSKDPPPVQLTGYQMPDPEPSPEEEILLRPQQAYKRQQPPSGNGGTKGNKKGGLFSSRK